MRIDAKFQEMDVCFEVSFEQINSSFDAIFYQTGADQNGRDGATFTPNDTDIAFERILKGE